MRVCIFSACYEHKWVGSFLPLLVSSDEVHHVLLFPSPPSLDPHSESSSGSTHPSVFLFHTSASETVPTSSETSLFFGR